VKPINTGLRVRSFIWGVTEPFRTDKTPAWASVLALLLALAPGGVHRIHSGRWDDYDPTVAVLTATLIALIWTAHYTFRSVRHARQAEERENVRRVFARQSMVVGVMAELDYLKPLLALLGARIAVRGVRFLERPQLRHALAHVDVLSPAAANDLSRFDSILRQIESHVALYEADFVAANDAAEKGWTGLIHPDLLSFDRKRVEDIRTLIKSAEALIPHLAQQLMQEG
jgi:hypothetical protein